MSNSYNMKNINKWKAVKIIFFFAMSLIIDTGFKNIYLIPLFLVLINFAYIWCGKKQRNSFIFAVITALITAIILRLT